MKRKVVLSACILFSALFVSTISFGQQGGQVNSKKDSLSTSGQGQSMQNSQVSNQALQNGNKNQNDSLFLEGGQYPLNQNLEYNQRNLIDKITPDNQNGAQNNQSNVAPGVQNQGNPSQALPSGQGSQSVPGNTGNEQKNQINPGINNNPGVPNNAGKQNPDSINKVKDKPVQPGQKP